MTARRRTEIITETDQILILRRRQSRPTWCAQCGREVDMVSQAEAQALTGMRGFELRDATEGRKWHFSESQDGTVLVCLESLRKTM